MSVALRVPRTEQPACRVRIDPVWRLRPELVFVGRAPAVDWANDTPWTRGAAVTSAPGVPGMGAGFPGGLGTAGNVITRGGGDTSAQTKVTFVAVARISASGYYPVIVSLKGGNTTNQGLYLGDTGGSGKEIGVIKGGVTALNAVNLAAGTYVFVASHRQDTGEYYMLARDLATGQISVATQTNTSASTGGNGTYAIGAARTDTDALNGAVYLAVASFDFLPRAAGQRLLLNPWQLFAPIERRSWASVGASAPTLIAASAINLTSTSFRPRVTFTR